MKRISFILLAGVSVMLASCWGRAMEPETGYKPVLMERSSLERSVVLMPPTKINSPGKIYYKDHYILISERFKGVHIVDNTDPKNPVVKGYINIPGCVDMAIRNNTLYADNAVDLVAIDLSEIANGQIVVKKRIKETFPELVPPDGLFVPQKYLKGQRPKNTIIVNWVTN